MESILITKWAKRKVWGHIRYYPKNRTALFLVLLKRTISHTQRRERVKCLNEKELRVVQKMGMTTLVTDETKGKL